MAARSSPLSRTPTATASSWSSGAESGQLSRFLHPVGSSGRIGVVFRQVRVQVLPGLRALDEDVGLGAELARVVQGADAQPDNVRPVCDLHIKRRAAIAAERADDRVAAVSLAE